MKNKSLVTLTFFLIVHYRSGKHSLNQADPASE